MSETNRTPRDGEAQDDAETQSAPSAEREVSPAAGPPFDWQVLLLRYLPQPAGSSHLIKRLAPR
jgi:hypothetical protein